ncbi:hypothetical protein RvY_01142 [Ramazzottius varieornatus]|uniref:Uncharacterized protein n=1 Tax=Ramazzottius varieornatus TaxID=947166 RepID=A0A1D1UJ87_RAMVA|nr:hypothetical protein RvY_01142 [Ramazzottius varieornatus]
MRPVNCPTLHYNSYHTVITVTQVAVNLSLPPSELETPKNECKKHQPDIGRRKKVAASNRHLHLHITLDQTSCTFPKLK